MTLFECNTDLTSMMDIAKVADQVCNYFITISLRTPYTFS